MDKKIDAHLVLDYRSGDHMALAKLVKRWHKPFCNKAYWIVKDPDLAKDIAQDSWTIIMGKIHTLNDASSFGSWALRIVYSKSLDALRTAAKKKIKREAYSKQQELEIYPESDDDDHALKSHLLKSIKSLPEHQQKVIKLFYVEDYALKEISDILDISVGTAKSRLFHARETLKRILKRKHYEK